MTKVGTYTFNIRGYGSAYVLVLIDGKRTNTVRGFQSNGFGEADNAYLPPVSMIERIEVIKGPASTLYGGDAVGGVINIITKKNPSQFTGSISLETQAQQHYNVYGHMRGASGLRYTQNNLFSGEYIPRGYLVYNITDWVTLKAGIAKGYKTPEAKHLSNSEFSAGAYGNPNLKPESSLNYEMGMIFDIFNYGNANITAFQTNFKDELSSDTYANGATLPNGIVCSNNGSDCSYRINRGKNQVRGLEVGLNSATYRGFSTTANYTYTMKKYQDGVKNALGADRVENIPKHIAMFKINYKQGKFNSFLKTTARLDTIAISKGGGRRAIPRMDKYKDFWVVDLGMNYKMTKNSSISVVVNNLLDKNFFLPYEYKSGRNGIAYVNSY